METFALVPINRLQNFQEVTPSIPIVVTHYHFVAALKQGVGFHPSSTYMFDQAWGRYRREVEFNESNESYRLKLKSAFRVESFGSIMVESHIMN